MVVEFHEAVWIHWPLKELTDQVRILKTATQAMSTAKWARALGGSDLSNPSLQV